MPSRYILTSIFDFVGLVPSYKRHSNLAKFCELYKSMCQNKFCPYGKARSIKFNRKLFCIHTMSSTSILTCIFTFLRDIL